MLNLTFESFIIKLIVAALLGMIIGLERDISGKEAGLRTETLITTGSCIFTIIGLYLPYYLSGNDNLLLREILLRNSGFLSVISNIVVGVGFLGAGIIIKQQFHVYGLTTAALIWFSSAIGILVGLGLFKHAIFSTFFALFILIFLKKNYLEIIKKHQNQNNQNNQNQN